MRALAYAHARGVTREWIGDLHDEKTASEIDSEDEPESFALGVEGDAKRRVRSGNTAADYKWCRAGLGFRIAKTLTPHTR